MALFQPFKPTTRMPGSKMVAATYRQGILDQQAKRDENALRSANTNRLTALADKGLAWNEEEGNPIGNYLREMMAGPGETDPATIDPRLEETDPALQSPTDMTGDPGYMGTESPQMSLGGLQGDVSVAPDSAAPPPPTGGNLFAPTYSPPADLTMEGATDMGAQVGADTGEAAAGDSIRGMLESLFSGGGDAATEAAVEQGTEQLADAGAEGAAEAAGSSAMPGLGTVSSLAQGDVKGAAAKYALSMLPPPYNMLAMLV